MTRWWLVGLVFVAYVLHQDFWLWRDVRPLVFGFLPVGLFYHACYSVGAAVVLALLVRHAWPAHLDPDEPSSPERAR